MPNRRALTRGGPLEATVLENLRRGHSVRAACAAAGVPTRTYYNHAGRSPAFRNDVAVALAEAERRLVGIVLDAAATDAKHAEWLLARRWPAAYGERQQIDMSVEQTEGTEVLALARRYAGMTDQEIVTELGRLAWVVPAANSTGEGQGTGNGAGTAMLALPAGAGDETPDVRPYVAGAAHLPEPAANADDGAPQPAEPLPPFDPHPSTPCPQCAGTVPGRHDRECPWFEPDGRLKHFTHLYGDPR